MSKMIFSKNHWFSATIGEERIIITDIEKDIEVLNVPIEHGYISKIEKSFNIFIKQKEQEKMVQIREFSLIEHIKNEYLNDKCDRNLNHLKTYLFLLKKMEYTQRKKFNILELVKQIEDETEVEVERGYNPFVEDFTGKNI